MSEIATACLACFWHDHKRANLTHTIHELDPAVQGLHWWEVRDLDGEPVGEARYGDPRNCWCTP